ncbi:hypothetical protein FRB94_007220 [Tulasnella sp. JGI-2019a]|nr:hypothetical protein FRB93_007277 [Tulasnella sp. JGI-2019a]KAG8998093.1 hypothetical protein FRB94_007220 [Tulasnella sp. JGI-2019a]
MALLRLLEGPSNRSLSVLLAIRFWHGQLTQMTAYVQHGSTNQSARSPQGPHDLPNDPPAAASRDQSIASRERHRQRFWIASYDKAVADGYIGSYELWKLSKHPAILGRRITGSCPYITSLKKLQRCPLSEELIRSIIDKQAHKFVRSVIVDNQIIGKAVFYIPAKGEQTPLKPIWVRPYFDPETKQLRFQLPDGSDHVFSRSLTELASSAARPLLRLAHSEGLIDVIPDTRLQTLKFDAARRSGFVVSSRIHIESLRPICRAVMHIRQIDREGRVAASDGLASFPFIFRPRHAKDRKYINYFPYIGDDDGKLRLWDVDEGRDVVLVRRKKLVSGLLAEEVRERYSPLYALARSEGFWADS